MLTPSELEQTFDELDALIDHPRATLLVGTVRFHCLEANAFMDAQAAHAARLAVERDGLRERIGRVLDKLARFEEHTPA